MSDAATRAAQRRAAADPDDHEAQVRALAERLRVDPPCPACTPGPDWVRRDSLRGWTAPREDLGRRWRLGLMLPLWAPQLYRGEHRGPVFVGDRARDQCGACGGSGGRFRWRVDLAAYCGHHAAWCAMEALPGPRAPMAALRPSLPRSLTEGAVATWNWIISHDVGMTQRAAWALQGLAPRFSVAGFSADLQEAGPEKAWSVLALALAEWALA